MFSLARESAAPVSARLYNNPARVREIRTDRPPGSGELGCLLRAGLPGGAHLAALFCVPELYMELCPIPKAARNMGIKWSMKKPSHHSKSWGFRKSIKCFRDAQDNLRCVQLWHCMSIPGQWGGLKAMGIPCSHQARVQLGLAQSPTMSRSHFRSQRRVYLQKRQEENKILALSPCKISQRNTKSGLGLPPFLPGLCGTVLAIWKKTYCHLVSPGTSTLAAEHRHTHYTACAHAVQWLRPAQELH